MIIDHISRLPLYRGLSPQLDRAFAFLTELDSAALAPGRIEIDEDRVYANCFETVTVSLTADAQYEAHNRYIDIHLPLKGCERVYLADRATLQTVIPYDNAGDCEMLTGLFSDFCTLDPKHFCVTFPDDAHLPMRAVGEPVFCKKLVVKVKV